MFALSGTQGSAAAAGRDRRAPFAPSALAQELTSQTRSHPTPRVMHRQLARHVAPAAAVVADTDDAPSTSAPSAPRPAGAAALAAASAAMLGSLPVPLSFEHRAGVRDAAGRVMLKNLPLPELEEWCASVGECGRLHPGNILCLGDGSTCAEAPRVP